LAASLHLHSRRLLFPAVDCRKVTMKRYLAIFATIFLLGAAGTVRAQDAPPPQDDRQAQQQAQDDDAPPPPDQNQADQIQIQDEAANQQSEQASQQEQQQQAAAQPGVARVSWIRGDVSTQRGDNGEWVAAIVNTPISQDDRISTGDKSRAELQLDYADTLRMSDRVTVKIATLTRSQILLQVGEGLTTYTVSRGAEASSEIDTPNASIRPYGGEGEFRILVNSDAETEVIVRRGSADISTPQGSTRVDAGQMISIAGTDNPQYKVAQAPSRDDWDNWNSDRNRTFANSEGPRRTNRYYTGSEDLDPYGRWTTVPDYGQVWVPNVAAGWAPYRAGRWVWQPYFGWTWVSYEPWGWAPYHYGRWLPYGAGWAWWPGPVAAYPAYYPVWAPAYVSFFGWGGGGFGVGVGFGFGFGHVGWLPCGPGDWYHPWYGRYGGRYNVVNVRNVTVNNFHNGWAPLHGGRGGFSNVNAAFRNDRVRSGISSMDSRSFGRGTVPAHQTALSAGEFRNASLVSGKMPVNPGRGSYSATNRVAGPTTIRNTTSNSQHFYSPSRNNNSGGAAQASRGFGATSNQRNNGYSGYSNSTRSAQPNMNGNRSSQPGTEGRTSNPAMGANRGNAPSSTARPGWHTFTPPSSSGANRTAPNAPSNNRAATGNPSNRGGYGAPNTTTRTYRSPNSQPNMRGPTTSNPGNRGGFGAPNTTTRTYQPPNSQPNMRGPTTNNPGNRGGFGAPNTTTRTYQPPNSQPNMRGPTTSNPGNRGGFGSPNSASRPYQPPNSQPNMRGPTTSNPSNRGGFGAPNGSASRGGYPGGGSRPPLSMRQPIVTPRNGGSSGGGSRGNSGGGNRGGGGGFHGGGGGSHKH
jgi:hypothetical protein